MKVSATDLFAGPGGWDLACVRFGIDVVGIELDSLACATRRAAGFTGLRTIEDDVRNWSPFPSSGLIASPPCPTFSGAGDGAGRAQMGAVLQGVKAMSAGDPLPEFSDPITPLVLEPLRWALAGQYEWMAFEQVRSVLPVWQAMAAIFRERGYSVVTGIVDAADYGVPQRRKRAVLLASRTRDVSIPAPSFERPTMAEAIGWGFTKRPANTVVSQSAGGPRLLDGGSGAWLSVLKAVEQGEWIRRPDRLHLTLNRGEVSTCSIRDGAILQTFPADYPWQGTITQQAKQVGNAVPPRLAAALLSAVTG